ncbi:hypothetical protein EE612_047710, partial [Oryza sativa]
MPFQLARLQAHPPQLMLSVEQGELVSWCLGPALDAQVELQQAREVEIPILLPPVLQVLPLVLTSSKSADAPRGADKASCICFMFSVCSLISS